MSDTHHQRQCRNHLANIWPHSRRKSVRCKYQRLLDSEKSIQQLFPLSLSIISCQRFINLHQYCEWSPSFHCNTKSSCLLGRRPKQSAGLFVCAAMLHKYILKITDKVWELDEIWNFYKIWGKMWLPPANHNNLSIMSRGRALEKWRHHHTTKVFFRFARLSKSNSAEAIIKIEWRIYTRSRTHYGQNSLKHIVVAATQYFLFSIYFYSN